MIGWIIFVTWVCIGLAVGRRVVILHEEYCMKEWPLTHPDGLNGDDWTIAIFYAIFGGLIGWPITLTWWAIKPMLMLLFRTPRAKASDAKRRSDAAVEAAWAAYRETQRNAGDSPILRDLADAQLIYAKSLGPEPHGSAR